MALRRGCTDGTGRLDAAHQFRVGHRARNVTHRLVGTVESQVRPMAGRTLLSLVIRSAIPATPLDRDRRDVLMKEEQPQRRSPVRFERAAVVELGPSLAVSEDQ